MMLNKPILTRLAIQVHKHITPFNMWWWHVSSGLQNWFRSLLCGCHRVARRVRKNNLLCKHTCTCSVHVFLWMTCVCLGVCVPPPSYCVPILRKRQKAHLDLVGWKVGRLHRALLVNSGLLPVCRTTPQPPPLGSSPFWSLHVLPA